MLCFSSVDLFIYLFYLLGQNRLHLSEIVSLHETQVWFCGLENVSRALHRKYGRIINGGNFILEQTTPLNVLQITGAHFYESGRWDGFFAKWWDFDQKQHGSIRRRNCDGVARHTSGICDFLSSASENLQAARSGKLLQSHTLMERCRGEFFGQSGGRGVRGGEKNIFLLVWTSHSTSF